MYLIRITLIGFIGSDAEKKAANATNIAIFSLATKTSWKNDAGSSLGGSLLAPVGRARHALCARQNACIALC